MNLRDAWAIDQHIDFDCHHMQLNLSYSVSTAAPPPPQHTHKQSHTGCKVTRELLVSMFFQGSKQTNCIILSCNKEIRFLRKTRPVNERAL